jgi:hypothetical protein
MISPVFGFAIRIFNPSSSCTGVKACRVRSINLRCFGVIRDCPQEWFEASNRAPNGMGACAGLSYGIS